MIANIWEKVEIYCNKHAELHKLELVSTNSRIYARCPLGDPEKYSEAELCRTQITLKDLEKVLEHIEKVILEAESEDTILCLTDYTFKVGKLNYKVIEHDHKIKITLI